MILDYHSYQDHELLQLIAHNDENAFAEIYRRYSSDMFLAAYNILHHRAGAEDAVQEIFISLWKRRAGLNVRTLKSYLEQSARYYVLRIYQQEKRDDQFYKRLAQVTSDILNEDPVLFRNIQQTLQEIIRSLPADQQTIYQLNRDHNMTYTDIANHLDISVKTVEKKMSKALKFLRPRMDDLLLITISFLLGLFKS